MLPVGSEVLAYYRGYLDDGTVIDEVGSPDAPAELAIGHYAIPVNVSNALGTMDDGETRTVKAGYRQKGKKPQMATYAVHFVRRVKMDAFEEEQLNGGKCSCGSHRVREGLSHAHTHDCGCSQHHVHA